MLHFQRFYETEAIRISDDIKCLPTMKNVMESANVELERHSIPLTSKSSVSRLISVDKLFFCTAYARKLYLTFVL